MVEDRISDPSFTWRHIKTMAYSDPKSSLTDMMVAISIFIISVLSYVFRLFQMGANQIVSKVFLPPHSKIVTGLDPNPWPRI